MLCSLTKKSISHPKWVCERVTTSEGTPLASPRRACSWRLCPRGGRQPRTASQPGQPVSAQGGTAAGCKHDSPLSLAWNNDSTLIQLNTARQIVCYSCTATKKKGYLTVGHTESELNPLPIVSTPCGSGYERTARLARLTSVGGPLRVLSFNSSISIVYLQKKFAHASITTVITETMSERTVKIKFEGWNRRHSEDTICTHSSYKI